MARDRRDNVRTRGGLRGRLKSPLLRGLSLAARVAGLGLILFLVAPAVSAQPAPKGADASAEAPKGAKAEGSPSGPAPDLATAQPPQAAPVIPPPPPPPPGWFCRDFGRCHKAHKTDKRPCPGCEKQTIPAEDAFCATCAPKSGACPHCGMTISTPGKPRPVDKEVKIAVPAKPWGTLSAWFCQDRVEIGGGSLPEHLPPSRPLLISLTGATAESVDAVLALAGKEMGKDLSKLAIEIRIPQGGAFGGYAELAQRIKKKDARILVGGPGNGPIFVREGLRDFTGAVGDAPVDFVSGDYNGAKQYAHHQYGGPDNHLYGVAKLLFDGFFDVSDQIGGKVNYPGKAGLALTDWGYTNNRIGTSPEELAFGATVVTCFATVNIQRKDNKTGRPVVLDQVQPAFVEVLKPGREELWPCGHARHGGPYDVSVPVMGSFVRDPATKIVYAILVNDSKKPVKAAVTIEGKGAADVYLDACEVKVLRF